ncbi:MAG TPA: TetR/AcrR family transcriptional regulator [Dongiaceae bacterium]|nr:TetR/AcrR family transcriptional regulator [Dongiaceae bacterium]
MRKAPQQKRSREMVSRLLEATGATIAERGLDNTTTNHIAERAGVSIGSLYQYFPDKDALVEALLVQLGEQIGRTFRRRAEALDFHQLRLRDVAALGIAYGMNLIRTDPLFSELTRNWNRVPIEKMLDPLERFFLVMAQPYFLRNYHNYPVQNLEAKLYVLINSTLFTAIRYLGQETRALPEQRLVETLADMIVTVLERPDTLERSDRVSDAPVSS